MVIQRNSSDTFVFPLHCSAVEPKSSLIILEFRLGTSWTIIFLQNDHLYKDDGFIHVENVNVSCSHPSWSWHIPTRWEFDWWEYAGLVWCDDEDNGDDKDKVAATESDPFVPSLNGRSCYTTIFTCGWVADDHEENDDNDDDDNDDDDDDDVLQAAISSSYAAASDAPPTILVEGKLTLAPPIFSHQPSSSKHLTLFCGKHNFFFKQGLFLLEVTF